MLRVHVVLYSRPGCHLCDEARAVIDAARLRTPFDLDEIDIEVDDELVKEYGIRIPVVVVNGVERFEISVEPDELARLVAERL
jgi:glutaredoxin